ncbi:MAG: GIY-YIG nuclease family protein [Spirochaetes bacterium]|nr:MAG: GIY-YIG nuclease family protein [Spirochaetota bacterium]
MNSGVYAILMYLPEKKEISFGKHKRVFERGYYVYVGSAMKNLDARVKRHISKKKRMKWHIDYLLKHVKILDVSRIHTTRRLECVLNKSISRLGSVLINGFGSSDCKCVSHLHYFRTLPGRKFRVKINLNGVENPP